MNILKKKKWIVVVICILASLLPMTKTIDAKVKMPTKPTYVTATAVKDCVNITWKKSSNAKLYQIYMYDEDTKKYKYHGFAKTNKYVAKNLKRGQTYQFKVRAYKNGAKTRYYSSFSKAVEATTSKKGYSTLKNYLKTALVPCGSTMYVWGGGWNQKDKGAGVDAKTIGASQTWRTFFNKQKKSYSTKKTRFQRRNGLDCSGFVGWSIYNIRNTANNKTGYVTFAKKMAKNFANRGWGTYRSPSKIKNYKAGDIMSTAKGSGGHVWIVLGQCKDGSVVLLHSSDPGVQISGTATRSGKSNSQAVKLAKKYMKKYYPKWYKKYPSNKRNNRYLKDYGQMRWNVGSDTKMMTDPDGYQKMSVEEVLKDLFTN